MIQTQIQRKHLYTPLRYPGGKTSLFRFFEKIIDLGSWDNITYIEPYAGGAGAGLSLLITGKVNSIVINDYDPTVFCFWKSVIERSDIFIERIHKTPVTIGEWHRQKEIYNKADTSNPLGLGFATFFLNRTNRSGILGAGPIGGQSQAGKWKIDARYKKQGLIKKIELIASYRDKIKVSGVNGIELFEQYASNPDVFFYIDPPYFAKGSKLYLNSFSENDHEDLAATLNDLSESKWVLTYDSVPEIAQLYRNRCRIPFDINYSAHHGARSGSEIMVFSDPVADSIARLE